MKPVFTFSFLASSLLFSGGAFAQCDSSLSHDEMVDCIVVEGSGENYTEWKQRFETEYRESQKEKQQAKAENRQSDGQSASIAAYE